MKQTKLSVKVLAAIIGGCLLVTFFCLAVLGENGKAKRTVEELLSNIQSQRYIEAASLYSKQSDLRIGTFRESMTFHFLLELSLLQYFNIIDEHDYTVVIGRDTTWFPLLGEKELRLNITLVPNASRSLVPTFTAKHPIENFITAVREDGRWKIKSINLETSLLKNTFDEIAGKIELDKYVTITPEGFTLKKAEIHTDAIQPLEKRVIIHNLETALETIRNT